MAGIYFNVVSSQLTAVLTFTFILQFFNMKYPETSFEWKLDVKMYNNFRFSNLEYKVQ